MKKTLYIATYDNGNIIKYTIQGAQFIPMFVDKKSGKLFIKKSGEELELREVTEFDFEANKKQPHGH